MLRYVLRIQKLLHHVLSSYGLGIVLGRVSVDKLIYCLKVLFINCLRVAQTFRLLVD